MPGPGPAELLLERDRELDALRAAMREAAAGRGRLALVEGPAGIGKSRLAVAQLERSPQRLERARALASLGGRMRRSRRPTKAREPLRRALEIAESCGAERLAEHTRSELYATGARPRTTALGGVEALTERELRVATMAAEGSSNRDIAQTLYVTPKTVEVHLTNAYRKLSIGSRRELPAALAAPASA